MAAPEARSIGPVAHYAADAQRYASCRVTQRVQQELIARTLQLLGPPAAYPLLLDLGCDNGHGQDAMAAAGWRVLGCDISSDMLHQSAPSAAAAVLDCVQLDMGQGLPLRQGFLPATISISAVQWVCKEGAAAVQRLFTSLHACLQPGARAVLQLYPDSPQQVAALLDACCMCGLQAALLMDMPHHTAACKYFLVLHKPDTAAGGRLMSPPFCPLSRRLGGGCILGWRQHTPGLAQAPPLSICDTWLVDQHHRHVRKLYRLLWQAAAHAQLLQPPLGIAASWQAGNDTNGTAAQGVCTGGSSGAAHGGTGCHPHKHQHWLRELCLMGDTRSCCGAACLGVLVACSDRLDSALACGQLGSTRSGAASDGVQAAVAGMPREAAGAPSTGVLQLLSTDLDVVSLPQLEVELQQALEHATVCRSRHSFAGASSYKGPRLEPWACEPAPACLAPAVAAADSKVAGIMGAAYKLKASQFAEYLVVTMRLQNECPDDAPVAQPIQPGPAACHASPSGAMHALVCVLTGALPGDWLAAGGAAAGMYRSFLAGVHRLQQLRGWSVHAALLVHACCWLRCGRGMWVMAALLQHRKYFSVCNRVVQMWFCDVSYLRAAASGCICWCLNNLPVQRVTACVDEGGQPATACLVSFLCYDSPPGCCWLRRRPPLCLFFCWQCQPLQPA